MIYQTTFKGVMFMLMFLKYLFGRKFVINVNTPKLLAEHFKNGIPYLEIMPGKNKENYEKTINIKSLSNNKTGCRKYKDNFSGGDNGNDIGILLVDSDTCSLSTKIHYAQEAGASVLFLKYIDDNIEEAEVDHSSFEGVRIPIFMLKASNAEFIQEILNSSDGFNTLQINLKHYNEIDRKHKVIDIFMSSEPLNNPMINFLKDLKEHSRLFKNYEINIKFSLGFCKSCKSKRFMRKEPNCLSGGRYCIINSEFRSNEPGLETLRQICIRNKYGTKKLIDYLIAMKSTMRDLMAQNSFKESEYSVISRRNMEKNGFNYSSVKQCLDDSFIKRNDQSDLDYDLDDNKLLKQEQNQFLQITKFNVFPLIIVNKVYYEGSINIRDFIKFMCMNHMIDCRGFRKFKKIFLVILSVISLLFVGIVIIFCRKVLRKKMDNELNIKVNEAIQKYLTVDKV